MSGREPQRKAAERRRPPRWIRRRLRRRLPPHLADEVLDELEGRYRTRYAESGRMAATLWYWRQASGVREAARASGWLHPAEWFRDLRHGARKLARRPAIAAALFVSLAFGIGANAAIFSVVNRVLLEPLPYPEPGRLRLLNTELPDQGSSLPRSSGPELLDLAEVEGFESFGGVWFRPGALTDDVAEPEEIGMAFVTAGFLPTLGVEPSLGRWPAMEEDVEGGEPVIVLAHHLWERRYGGDPSVVGERIEFDGVPHTVVGVMPASFRVLVPQRAGVPALLDAWVPFGGGYDRYPRDWRVFTVVARMADGAVDRDVDAELSGLATRLAATHETYAGSGLSWRLESLSEGVVAPVRPMLSLLLGAVALMLLIVCANSLNLVAAGMSEGRHELAVRSALGASTGRLMRQLAAESLVVVTAGALAGVLLARWGIVLLPRLAPEGLPRLHEIGLDWRVLGYVALLSLGTVVLLSVSAAFRLRSAGGPGIQGRRGAGDDRSQSLFRNALVVFEVAVCLVLLVGLGLLVQSFGALLAVDPGFAPQGLHTVKISLVDAGYPYSGPAAIASFYRQLEERLADAAGIESSGATTLLPFDGGSGDIAPYGYETEQGATEWGSLSADDRTVTPGYLEALGARLLAGRHFLPTDHLDAPSVVIVDDRMAAKLWPDRQAVGQRLRVERFLNGQRTPHWAEVVGVVEHIRQDPARAGVEQIFVPHAQRPMRTMTLAIRTRLDPDSLQRTLAAAVREIDPGQPIQGVVPMASYVAESRAPTRFALTLLALFAGVAMLLALVGTYGVISYSVQRRTRELGIQLALGATPAKLRRAVIARGAALVAFGVALGLGGALAASRALAGLLHGVEPTDPATYAGVTALLAAVALAACWLPARRASRLDPVTALRDGSRS